MLNNKKATKPYEYLQTRRASLLCSAPLILRWRWCGSPLALPSYRCPLVVCRLLLVPSVSHALVLRREEPVGVTYCVVVAIMYLRRLWMCAWVLDVRRFRMFVMVVLMDLGSGPQPTLRSSSLAGRD